MRGCRRIPAVQRGTNIADHLQEKTMNISSRRFSLTCCLNSAFLWVPTFFNIGTLEEVTLRHTLKWHVCLNNISGWVVESYTTSAATTVTTTATTNNNYIFIINSQEQLQLYKTSRSDKVCCSVHEHYTCTGCYTCLQLQWTDHKTVSSLWFSGKVNDQDLHKILKRNVGLSEKCSWNYESAFNQSGRQVYGPGYIRSKSEQDTWLGPGRNQPLNNLYNHSHETDPAEGVMELLRVRLKCENAFKYISTGEMLTSWQHSTWSWESDKVFTSKLLTLLRINSVDI